MNQLEQPVKVRFSRKSTLIDTKKYLKKVKEQTETIRAKDRILENQLVEHRAEQHITLVHKPTKVSKQKSNEKVAQVPEPESKGLLESTLLKYLSR